MGFFITTFQINANIVHRKRSAGKAGALLRLPGEMPRRGNTKIEEPQYDP